MVGISAPLPPVAWVEIRAFTTSVERLAVNLRELACRVRETEGHEPMTNDVVLFNQHQNAIDLIPLHLELAFSQARRLGDQFTRAVRHVLFEHVNSAPREYKKLRKLLERGAGADALGPLVDIALLRHALCQHSGWMDSLREHTLPDGRVEKGIRDIIEHHPAVISVHHGKTDDEPWQIHALLGAPIQGAHFRTDLLPLLRDITCGMADLWTAICRLTELPRAAEPWIVPTGDALPLRGRDDDSTAFWPKSVAT